MLWLMALVGAFCAGAAWQKERMAKSPQVVRRFILMRPPHSGERLELSDGSEWKRVYKGTEDPYIRLQRRIVELERVKGSTIAIGDRGRRATSQKPGAQE